MCDMQKNIRIELAALLLYHRKKTLQKVTVTIMVNDCTTIRCQLSSNITWLQIKCSTIDRHIRFYEWMNVPILTCSGITLIWKVGGTKFEAPKRRRSKRRRRRGGREWGRGIPLPSRLGVWGSVVSSPSGVRKIILAFSEHVWWPLVACLRPVRNHLSTEKKLFFGRL